VSSLALLLVINLIMKSIHQLPFLPLRLLAIGVIFSFSSDLSAAVLTFDGVNNAHVTTLGIQSYGSALSLGGAVVASPVASAGAGGSPTWMSSNGAVQGYNPNATVIVSIPLIMDPSAFSLSPGNGGEFSVIRVSADILGAGTYALTGNFWGQVLTGTSSDVHLLKNGAAIFGGNVNGFGPSSAVPFSVNVTLSAGDTLDFAVGSGGSIAPGSDYTGLIANFTPVAVPEPAGLPVLMLTGLMVFTQRRRHPSTVKC
jgi:hypothetical protein